jgi:hypothetical protein
MLVSASDREQPRRNDCGERYLLTPDHSRPRHLPTRILGESTLGPKLPQMMVHVQVGVSHPFGPRHPTERCVRSELALRTTEAIKKNAKILQIGRELGR